MDGFSMYRILNPTWILDRLTMLASLFWLISFIAPASLENFLVTIFGNKNLDLLNPIVNSAYYLAVEVNFWLIKVLFVIGILALLYLIKESHGNFLGNLATWLMTGFFYLGAYSVAITLILRFILKDSTPYFTIFDYPTLGVTLVPYSVWLIVTIYSHAKK